MENEWKKVKLKDLGKIVTGKTPSSKIHEPFSSHGVLFVTPRDMKGQRWITQTERYISDAGLKAVKNSFIPEDSIAVSCIGSDMGKVNILKLASVTNQQINSIIVDKFKYDPLFIYYSLSLMQDYLKSIASGSATPILNKNDFGECEIHIPSKERQSNISLFIKVLDDKIEANNKINQTLEQFSQIMFKSWFVDFDPVIDNALDAGKSIPEALQSRAELRQKVRKSADFKPLPADIRVLFPAEFEETELGWVPKGWITTSFNDLIELIGGGTPKTSVEEYWNGDIPWFSVVDAPNESDVYVLTTEKNITTEGLNNSSAKLLRKGTTIISARGTVGKCAMVAVPMAMNQSCYGVIGKNNISDEYIYFQLKNAVQTLQQMGHGSVFNTITRDTFKNIKVPFCNEELTNSYSLLVKNYFSKILNNNYQNIALSNLRDTLLPKLISGELSLEGLPDLIKQTEAA